MPLAALAALLLVLGLAACGGSRGGSSTASEATEGTEATPDPIKAVSDPAETIPIIFNPENREVSLTIGSKNFPEQEILGEIYAQALAAAGYKVKTALDLGSETIARKAVRTGQISAYPEYASTALTSFFGFEPDEVPSNPEAAQSKANMEFLKEGLQTFNPTPFASANAVGTTRETAEKYGLKTISDLKGVSEKLSLYGSPECRQRIDCLAGLEKLYGLKFKSFTPVDIGLRYSVLEKGEANLSILFTTDPQLSAESDKFVILKDDKKVFPAGNVIFVHKRATAWEAGSGLELTVQEVQEGLTLQVMQELNARVELEKETPEEVARAYLESAGYIS
ncbi:MAG TPA: glycine betaine ABC transporter substrate-binding protein [Solirubrobacterales bacterium]|nr:glycine betaine ABC transporter substrate-binding protein [Solirubrobacterales bacterium]